MRSGFKDRLKVGNTALSSSVAATKTLPHWVIVVQKLCIENGVTTGRMDKAVKQLAHVIVAREGGFVDDPDEPGGATKFGVTIHIMRNLGLDSPRRGIYGKKVLDDQCRVLSEGVKMGLINTLFSTLFGGKNIVKQTDEVFRPKAKKQSARGHAYTTAALAQFLSEFGGQGWFNRFVDGLNRMPRPTFALGTIALFVSALFDPLWFAERMQGLVLVPEQLWWLLLRPVDPAVAHVDYTAGGGG